MAITHKNEIESVRVPLIGNPDNRDLVTSKDQRFVNGYFDIHGDKDNRTYFFNKRPGLRIYSQPPGANAVGRGIYSWNGSVYTVWGAKIYKDNTDLGFAMATSTGWVGIEEMRVGAGTPRLCFNDGTKLYTVTSGGTTATITTIPANTRDLVYLDGYFFVMKPTTASIYQCDLDDPTTWDASKYITMMMSQKTGVAVARQTNVVLGMSSTAIQAFYDEGNVSGSVLTNIPQATHTMGIASADSLAYNEEEVIWVANTENGGYSVVIMPGTSEIKQISTVAIDKILRGEGSSISSCWGNLVRICGHKFYILNLSSSLRTLVYDFNTDYWMEWRSRSDGTFPFQDYTAHNGAVLAQHLTNGRVYTLSETAYSDEESNVGERYPWTTMARFSRHDYGDNNRKFVKTAEVIGDVSSASVSLQYSDDDWANLSTARILSLAENRAFTTGLGNYRRRAWQITNADDYAMRLSGLHLQLRYGVD